jgi:hypothetical protein
MTEISVHEILQNLGRMGGKKTLENHGKDYFAKISKLAHAEKKRLREARKAIQKENEKI